MVIIFLDILNDTIYFITTHEKYINTTLNRQFQTQQLPTLFTEPQYQTTRLAYGSKKKLMRKVMLPTYVLQIFLLLNKYLYSRLNS